MKSYFYAQGNWPEMCREHVGREMRADRYGGLAIHTGEPYKAIPYGHDNWRPEDRVFEVRHPGRFTSRGDGTLERSMMIVRELTPAQVFGAAYARGEAIAAGVSKATFGQAERLIEAWRALPNGLEHCEHDELRGQGCECKETPGSQLTLEDPIDSENGPIDDRLSHAHGLLNRYARYFLEEMATEVWWYRAGQAGIELADRRHGQGAQVPGKGALAQYEQEATQAAYVMTGAALCWRALTREDRQAWGMVAAAVDVSP